MNDKNSSPDARVKELIDSLIKAGVDTKTPEVQGFILSLLSGKDVDTREERTSKDTDSTTKEYRYVPIMVKVKEMGYSEDWRKKHWRGLGRVAGTARKQGLLKGVLEADKHWLYLDGSALEQLIQDFFTDKAKKEQTKFREQVIVENINNQMYVAVVDKATAMGYALSTCKELESDLSVFLKTKTKIPAKLDKKSKGKHLFLDSEELEQAIQEFMQQNTTPLLFRLESNSTPVDGIPNPISVTGKALEMDYPKLLVCAHAHSLGMFVKKRFKEKGIKKFHGSATHNYENCSQLGELVREFFEIKVKDWKGRMAT